jgi:hypothetical protein
MVTILDPTDEREPVHRQVAPRPDALSGVVGLLDISKPRGNVLLDELERLLRDVAPDVEVRRFRKPTFTKPCPEALRQEIRETCDFVVEGLAD